MRLTERDLNLLAELRLGRSNKEIGISLGLATGTVKVYMATLSAKFGGGKSRLELALWAERQAVMEGQLSGAVAVVSSQSSRSASEN